jgi:hypothetical protein
MTTNRASNADTSVAVRSRDRICTPRHSAAAASLSALIVICGRGTDWVSRQARAGAPHLPGKNKIRRITQFLDRLDVIGHIGGHD